MRFRTTLQWTLGAHLFALSIAYFIQPKKQSASLKPMRQVTVQLKPPPAPKQATRPVSKPAAKPVSKPTRKPAAKKRSTKKAPASKKPAQSKQAPTPKQAPVQPVPVDYQHLLIARLKEQLELPEIGSVEIKITFGKNGAIAQVDVLSSQSAANSRYLVSAIKKIELPPLPRNLRGSCEPLTIEFSSAGS